MLAGAAQILPRQSNIRDLGYSDRPRGWYDAQCQGADNDYCRWVGDAPNIFWSCALAGATSEYTPGGIFTPETTTNTTTCPTGEHARRVRTQELGTCTHTFNNRNVRYWAPAIVLWAFQRACCQDS